MGKAVGILLLVLAASQSTGQAAEVDWNLVEMTPVAEVMRERGWSMRPFCASRRKDLAGFVAKQGAKVRKLAKLAITEARAGSQTVKGASHYENIEAFGMPTWAKGKPVLAK